MKDRKRLAEIVKGLYEFCGIKIADCNKSIILSGIEEKTPRYAETIVIPNWFNTEDNFEKHINEIVENNELNNITFYAHVQDFNYIINLFKDFDNLKIIRTFPFVLEIMHKDVSKYTGIKFLKEKYNIDDKNIVVTGDGDNDFEMLSECSNSFAMKNGTEKALQAGKHKISNVFKIKKFVSIK